MGRKGSHKSQPSHDSCVTRTLTPTNSCELLKYTSGISLLAFEKYVMLRVRTSVLSQACTIFGTTTLSVREEAFDIIRNVLIDVLRTSPNIEC